MKSKPNHTARMGNRFLESIKDDPKVNRDKCAHELVEYGRWKLAGRSQRIKCGKIFEGGPWRN
jgi:hypothetical protein